MFTGKDMVSDIDIVQQSLDTLLTVGNGRRAACMHQVYQLLAKFIIGLLQPYVKRTSGRMACRVNIIKENNLINIQMEGHLRWGH